MSAVFLLMNLCMIFQTALKICKNNYHTMLEEINLLETLCKMEATLYLLEESRKAHQILKFRIALFSHVMTIKIHMDGHTKSMSETFMAFTITAWKGILQSNIVCFQNKAVIMRMKKLYLIHLIFSFEPYFQPPPW